MTQDAGRDAIDTAAGRERAADTDRDTAAGREQATDTGRDTTPTEARAGSAGPTPTRSHPAAGHHQAAEQAEPRPGLSRRRFIGAAGGSAAAAARTAPHAPAHGGPGHGHPGPGGPGGPGDPNGPGYPFLAPGTQVPDETMAPGGTELSDFFATAYIEYANTVPSQSDGDLWPSAWADDGEIYAANGDGKGFDLNGQFSDIVVNRISGTPQTGITGTRLASGNDVGPVWSDPTKYNHKPTGMTCVGSTLYLAVQDLRYGDHAFEDVPAASISRSDDHGATWHPTAQPMFSDHRFTTVFFLDFGQAGANARRALGPVDGAYVYAYGLDFNWRDSTDNTTASPTRLYLARVPRDRVQDRSAYTFYAGAQGRDRRPSWSPQITDKVPVLVDERRLYEDLANPAGRNANLSVISQGSVVYNPALRRYLYTSWSDYTYEFYESPTPWGPFRLFLRHDAGATPWFGAPQGAQNAKNGGYATTIPSKFISGDGLTMYVQSNWFVGGAPGTATGYHFALRKLTVTLPGAQRTAPRAPGGNLARAADAIPFEKSAHFGHPEYYNDGDLTKSEDSFDSTNKILDFWGYTFASPRRIGRVRYTTGQMFPDGGWFSAYDGGLRVEVRRGFRWVEVTNLTTTPDYPYDNSAGPSKTYTLSFDPVTADGVRIIGQPGGSAFFTSIAELAVDGG